MTNLTPEQLERRPRATKPPEAPARRIPHLDAVVTAEDVSTKGAGNYKADYVNWCRTAHLLRQHAPDWQFHLRKAPNGGHVWEAPNGTGYVVGYFTDPNGEPTADFPQAVMGNKNDAIPVARIDARDITDTHRRCLCTAAAATFGLAWQLWAREPLEDPHQAPERQRVTRQQAAASVEMTIDELQMEAIRAAKRSGLTGMGVEALRRSLAKGTNGWANVPEKFMYALIEQGVKPENVEKFNAEGEALRDRAIEESAPEEEPASHAVGLADRDTLAALARGAA
jgi:hypothetical protein